MDSSIYLCFLTGEEEYIFLQHTLWNKLCLLSLASTQHLYCTVLREPMRSVYHTVNIIVLSCCSYSLHTEVHAVFCLSPVVLQ